MKHMIAITLLTVVLGVAPATAQHTGPSPHLPETQCSEIKYHDFHVGTVSTFCEPAQGEITVYEHTYTNGFTIFDSDGDSRVDRYCGPHGCRERTEISDLSETWRNHETLFFESWDKVLKSLPSVMLADRGVPRPFFALDAGPQVRIHEPCVFASQDWELFAGLIPEQPHEGLE